MKFVPQAQQIDATRNLVRELVIADRATSVMACGTGKSLLGPLVAEELNAKSVVVFVPSLFLMKQCIHTWQIQGKLTGMVSVLCVCSEDMDSEIDDLSIEDSDLGFLTTTKPVDVRTFLESAMQDKVIFATYQSARVLGHALNGVVDVNGGSFGFDLGIYDEAHRTCGEKGSLFAYSLDDRNINIRKRMFLTATPKVVKGRSADKDVRVIAMNDQSIYGRHVYTLSFAKAANQGIIAPYKLLVTVIDSAVIDSTDLSEGVVHDDALRHSAKDVADMQALTNAMTQYGLSKAISFHTDTAAAMEFSKVDLQKGLHRFHVNGRQKASLRDAMMDGFKGISPSLITNARCLTEGVDVPSVDLVAFLSPKSSVIDIVQAAGRCMRKSPGKTHGYILLPLYVDVRGGEKPESALERSNFAEIYRVLNSLKENDDSLNAQVRNAGISLGQLGEDGLARSLFGETLEINTLNGSSIDRESLIRAVQVRLLTEMGETWDMQFGRLKAFYEANGHCDVPRSDAQLGTWVNKQRVAMKNSTIPKERRTLLEGLGFNADVFTQSWNRKFLELKAYFLAHGDCNVKSSTEIGLWVSKQRASFKAGTLSEHRHAMLSSINLNFNPIANRQTLGSVDGFATSISKFRRALRYSDGDFSKLDLESLQWLATQCVLNRNPFYRTEHTAALNALGFFFTLSNEAKWRLRLLECADLQSRTGSIPRSTASYRWLKEQRRLIAAGEIQPKRLDDLIEHGLVDAADKQPFINP